MLQINRIPIWFRLCLFLSSLLLINVTSWIVLDKNQRNGLYPIDADSIGLPLVSIMIESLFVALFFAFNFLIQTKALLWKRNRNQFRFISASSVTLSLYGVMAWLGTSALMAWWDSDHYLIALSYFIFLINICFDAAVFVSQYINNQRGVTH